ncbi:hypothetical protein JOM56_014169 [Amanita muscaria]
MIGSSFVFNLSEVGKTNYYYHTEEEKQLIRDTIRCTTEALRRLEIKKMPIVLRERELKSDLERYLIATAPIKQLPCDVLCFVFELHCQDEPPLLFQSKPAQVTLSHVCSAWRRAMLDFPKLWNNIVIAPQHRRPNNELVEIANAWLSRAKDLPCSVEFEFPPWDVDDDWDYRYIWQQHWHKNIVKNFVSRHKFKRLGVTFADHHLRDFLQLPDEKLLCIEDLRLQHVTSNNDKKSKLDFHKLVNLTSFSLLPIPFLPIQVRRGEHVLQIYNLIPWHQLRHIQLRVDVPVLFGLTIMERCSATLETCSLVVSSSVPPFSRREPIHCSRLRDFMVDILECHDVDVIDPFLLSLRLPNLKSLTLGCNYPRFPIDPRTLIRMQNISSMRLEELVLSDTTSEIDVQVLLALLPSLRRLEVPRKVRFTAATICELGAGSIGANLEDLRIGDNSLDIVALLQMVKTRSSNRKEDMRRAKATPFKSVVLRCKTDDTKLEVDQLMEEIKRLGVYLEVI